MRFSRYVIAVIGMLALVSWSATALAQSRGGGRGGGGSSARSGGGDRGSSSRAQSQRGSSQRSGQARSSRGSSQRSAQSQRSSQARGQAQSQRGRSAQGQRESSGRSAQAQAQRSRGQSQAQRSQGQAQRSRDQYRAQGRAQGQAQRGGQRESGQARGSREGRSVPRVVTQGGDQRTRGQSGWQYYRDRGSRDADARSRTQGRADDIARDRGSQGDRGQRDRDARSRDQRDRDATPRASGRTWQYADRVRDRDWNRGADRSGDRDQRGDRDGNRDRDRDWDGNRGGHGDRYADYWRRDRDHNHNHNHQRSRYGYGYNRFVVSLAIGRPYGLYRPYYGGSLYSYNRGRYYGYPYYGGGNAGRYYGTRYTTGYTPTQYATEQYAVQEYIAQPEPTSTSVIPTNSAAASYQEAAEAAFREGRYEEALRHSSHALIEDGENGYVHLFLSQTLFAVGDYEGAAVTLDQGLSMLDPENWGYVVENYEAFYTGDGYVTQMNELVTFLEENPDASYGYLVRGYHYLYLGELAGARLQLERAVELEPRDPFGVELLKAAGGEVPASVSEATAPRAAAEPSAPAVPAAGGE